MCERSESNGVRTSTVDPASRVGRGRAGQDRRGASRYRSAERERGGAGLLRSKRPALQREERAGDVGPAVARRNNASGERVKPGRSVTLKGARGEFRALLVSRPGG